MVANVLDMQPEQLLQRLRAIAERHAEDPEYRTLRADLPADWSF